MFRESPIIEEMADPTSRYYQGLAKFEYLILYANAIHDRTVAFFTSYICDRDPFKNIDHIEFVHENPPSKVHAGGSEGSGTTASNGSYPSSPTETNSSIHDELLVDGNVLEQESGGGTVRDNQLSFPVVDITRTRYLPHSNGISNYSTREYGLMATMLALSPVLLPILLMVTTTSSIVSSRRVADLENAMDSSHHISERHRRASISEEIAQFTGNMVEEVLSSQDHHDANELTESVEQADRQRQHNSLTNRSDATNDKAASSELSSQNFIKESPQNLLLDDKTLKMIDSLNKLPWEKHVVHIFRAHSHAEIVNRRNMPGQGQLLVESWADKIASRIDIKERDS